ncbi:MAG: 2Fe-2S iron-sulfur cluster binding domain-containing protein [Gammaproteobacteria bacterium]|nr:MAG: 2Fe-2S iron-sulfur cluster binding domain-containing protein [Gammaproteobacteria bacterium]
MDNVSISVKVNGRQYEREVEPRKLLSDFLRHDLGLTGTHVGCEHGICGACTILLDGKSVRSCLTFAVVTNGAEIKTIEGHAANGKMSPLQEAFWENHGLQCGYCTPGMLATAQELLDANPNPTVGEVREALSGNLCRCTGYQTIVDSILAAAETIRGEG